MKLHPCPPARPRTAAKQQTLKQPSDTVDVVSVLSWEVTALPTMLSDSPHLYLCAILPVWGQWRGEQACVFHATIASTSHHFSLITSSRNLVSRASAMLPRHKDGGVGGTASGYNL